MKKKTNGRGFPVESLVEVIRNSKPVKGLSDRIKFYCLLPEVERLRLSVKMLTSLLILSNGIVLFLGSQDALKELGYNNFHQVTKAIILRPQPPPKSFGPVWDSLMADPSSKNRWDSLVRLRPGLRDTMRQLRRMDSAVSGR